MTKLLKTADEQKKIHPVRRYVKGNVFGGLGGAAVGAAAGSLLGPVGTVGGGLAGGVAGRSVGKAWANRKNTKLFHQKINNSSTVKGLKQNARSLAAKGIENFPAGPKKGIETVKEFGGKTKNFAKTIPPKAKAFRSRIAEKVRGTNA